MHDLVLENVLELGVRAGERQENAMAERLGDATDSLTDVGDVVLLELAV